MFSWSSKLSWKELNRILAIMCVCGGGYWIYLKDTGMFRHWILFFLMRKCKCQLLSTTGTVKYVYSGWVVATSQTFVGWQNVFSFHYQTCHITNSQQGNTICGRYQSEEQDENILSFEGCHSQMWRLLLMETNMFTLFNYQTVKLLLEPNKLCNLINKYYFNIVCRVSYL
jgi:hypothetical protein